MHDIELYLLEFGRSRDEASKIAEQTSKKLQEKKSNLLGLIESLGEFLNSEDSSVRARTVSYLAEVLAALPKGVLSIQQRALLYDFILSRLSDGQEGVSACARALLALEEKGHWSDEQAASVLKSFLEHTSPLRQIKSQSERFRILNLIDLLLSKYREAIHKMHVQNVDFMPRFVSYFEGEKDPRNLMVIFSILKVPMTEWDVSSSAQDLFEAVFNYFPVTFRPPPDDPYGITTPQLKERLCDCIAANGIFAPFTFPALLDKLDSTSSNTKRDTLNVILACIFSYGPNTISTYAVTLWDALKYEILNAQEDDLAETALVILGNIAKQLSQAQAEYIGPYVKPIMKECNDHFEDAPTKQSQAAARILRAVAKASQKSFNIVVKSVLLKLLTMYQTAEAYTRRRGLLEIVIQIIHSGVDAYGTWRAKVATVPVEHIETNLSAASQRNDENAFLPLQEQVVNVMINALAASSTKEISFRLVAIDGLIQLSTFRDLLKDQEFSNIIRLLCAVTLDVDQHEIRELRSAALDALVKVAHQRPQLVIDFAFPEFMAQLAHTDVTGAASPVPILEAFAMFSTEDQLFSTVVVRLKGKLQAALREQASIEYLNAILSALLYSFVQRTRTPGDNTLYESYYHNLVKPLLHQAADDTHTNHHVFSNEGFLDLLGRLCNEIIRPLSTETQDTIAQELHQDGSERNVRWLELRSSSNQARLMVVSTYLTASFRREVKWASNVGELIESLVAVAIHDVLSRRAHEAVLQQISLLFNKTLSHIEVDQTLNALSAGPDQILDFATLTEKKILVTFAISKALILRNSPKVEVVLAHLTNALKSPDWGMTVARGFSTLLRPDGLLTKDNHCVIYGLHRQKLYALVVPNLVQALRNAKPENKTGYLIAISGILRWLPYSVIEPELTMLVPVLLQSLDLTDEDEVKNTATDTLTMVLLQNPRAIQEHAGSLISRLLNIATSPNSSPKLRIAGLRCLKIIPAQVPGETVLPYKRQVVKALVAALDDKKRGVRADAVRCRAQWMAMDDVNDEEGR